MGRSFSDILGHEREISVLNKAISKQRVAHSFLFTGPEGVGKRLTALAFARVLNCEAPKQGDSCGRCESCALMDGGGHLNLITVAPVDGYLKIERIRQVQDALKYRAQSGVKVAVVEGAESMMKPAANAFLKTLEEPPEGSVIILISSQAADLLPTIVSRCRRVNFRPLAREVIAKYLVENEAVGQEEAELTASWSAGSLGRALSDLSSGALERRRAYVERFAAIAPDDTDELMKFAATLSRDEELVEVLEFFKRWLRDGLVALEGADPLVVGSNLPGFTSRTGGNGVAPRALLSAFSALQGAQRDITPPRNANKQLTMEVLFTGLAAGLIGAGMRA